MDSVVAVDGDGYVVVVLLDGGTVVGWTSLPVWLLLTVVARHGCCCL